MQEDYDLIRESSKAGYSIMKWKGYSNFAVAAAAALIITGIVKDTRRTMPVSTLLSEFYGTNDICLSVPVVVGRNGVERILKPEFNEEELRAFRQSADEVNSQLISNGLKK